MATKQTNRRRIIELEPNFPTIVTLCGSIRFVDQYIVHTRKETLEGKIVISVGMFGHQEGLDPNSQTKVALDHLHLRKIDLADEILVINVGGYIGESTSKEIQYAIGQGKVVRYAYPASMSITDNTIKVPGFND